jgi:endogenous inhibitor of DNA gyrase (YacG/DUF329 family)
MAKLARNFFGENNPNFKNGGKRICLCCSAEYKSYNKTSKYCSNQCYVKDQRKRIVESASKGAKAERKPRIKLGYRCVCKTCNVEFRSLKPKQRYCEAHKSDARINQGRGVKKKKPENSVTKPCLSCKQEFTSFKSANRIYCCYQCHLNNNGAWTAGMAASKAIMKYGAKKDANHDDVVSALKGVGACVIDMSNVGRGFPDLIVGFDGLTILVEVKNPKTSYGRKGLNKNQVKWKEMWSGGAYCVVDSPDAALRAIGAKKEQA